MDPLSEEELRSTLRLLQSRGTELDDIEAKSARQGTPAVPQIARTLSAFANRSGGGIILFGIDPQTYRPNGIANVDEVQVRVSEAAAQMEPAVRPSFAFALVDGLPVLAVEVAETPLSQRPCYYRPAGLHRGSYLRSGDGDRLMTDYEIHLMLSSRGLAKDDRQPVDGASIDDLDQAALDRYLAQMREHRPVLASLGLDRAGLLRMLNILGPDRKVPTLAGLLLFGVYPQHFFPGLVLSVTAYPDAGGSLPTTRFLSDVRCEGPLTKMVESAMASLARALPRRVVVSGLLHEEIPEYPTLVLRELLVNAVIHRDYSQYALGTQVQVRLHGSRIEIENPGGLFGAVSVDQLGMAGTQSARNQVLVSLAEDLGLVENRGTGLFTVIQELRRAHLAPPLWRDALTSFQVTLSNATLLDQAALDWLSQLAPEPLSDRQRYALAHMRRYGPMASGAYQTINGVDAQIAGRELKHLVQLGLLRTQGQRRGMYYDLAPTLLVDRLGPTRDQSLDPAAALVLESLQAVGTRTTAEIARDLDWPRSRVLAAVNTLIARGLVVPTNPRKHARNQAYRALSKG